ncbi:MAG: hypothetical protein LBH31_03870 [Burkholderiaceae bacterium]|nr:hypothetical protein [Burkholderiaceae bacterium]
MKTVSNILGMDAINLFWHIVNFIAPALWLGLVMMIWDLWAKRASRPAPRRRLRGLLLDWGIGIAVLLAGLVITGHDGRMFTYGALALAVSGRRWLAEMLLG